MSLTFYGYYIQLLWLPHPVDSVDVDVRLASAGIGQFFKVSGGNQNIILFKMVLFYL